MNRREFLAVPVAAAAAAAARPNVVVVMMDDFGIGQFAPLVEGMATKDFDPAFVDFTRKHGAQYTPEEALAAARKAMPCVSELSRKGVLFTNAFAASNLCAPARTAVLTGRQPNRFGFYENADVESTGLPAGSVLVERLQRAGYATALVGKYHCGTRNDELRQAVLNRHGLAPAALGKLPAEKRQAIDAEIRASGYFGSVIDRHDPRRLGFDFYCGYNHYEAPFYDAENIWDNGTPVGKQPRYNTEYFTDKALDFIRGAKRPFFLELCYHAVHGPLRPKAPDKYFSRFPSASYELTNFYAHVNAVDEGIRALRAELERKGEWENTLFMFCGDNGGSISLASPLPGNAPVHGHKGMYLQGGIRVPMMAHWPKGPGKPGRNGQLVSTMDLLPTALAAASVDAPSGLDGRSLLPTLDRHDRRIRETLFWSGIHARSWGFWGETTIGRAEPRREESPGAWAVTDGEHLLRFTGTVIPGLFQDLPDGRGPRHELFDVRRDPGETKDVFAARPEVARKLAAAWKRERDTLPPPPRWNRRRWDELIDAKNALP